MLTIQSTGSIAAMVRSVRDVPARVIPYATSTALTRVAKIAQTKDLPAEMNRVFDRPTPYTLNSLFVKPATAQTLSARVMVKNEASSIAPERFLQPEVEGGTRSEKRFERALRYGGWLQSGERAIPALDMPRDAFGNVSGPRIKSILAQLEKPGGRSTRTGRRGKTVSTGAYKSGLFVGRIGRTRGIWQRDRRAIKPLFIFSSALPQYRARFDFTGVAEKVALEHFPVEFTRAVNDLLAKGAAA